MASIRSRVVFALHSCLLVQKIAVDMMINFMMPNLSLLASRNRVLLRPRFARPILMHSARPGMKCSLFLPYKGLPPEGLMLPKNEELCDVTERNCRSLVYVYEEPCEPCSGTGYVRASSSHGGRRGKWRLNVCLECVGLGFVRVTTNEEPSDRDQCLILLRRNE